ncbi:hypothetical protein BV25DRAFT_1820643 [Artomyces pyxidatus]|uniref:Uncharacterized protein n=1 Tax=Artomyces pyxidatus TaxID=48021 RepID=A0ACB8TDV9_9AGAM|nr:hypothetical protein BV25DRAFT_1820643 [Artomyces pyxidatus]
MLPRDRHGLVRNPTAQPAFDAPDELPLPSTPPSTPPRTTALPANLAHDSSEAAPKPLRYYNNPLESPTPNRREATSGGTARVVPMDLHLLPAMGPDGFPRVLQPEISSIPLHPFERPDPARVHNLLDLVLAKLPPTPPLYQAKALASTKQTTASELRTGSGDKLQKLLYVPALVSQVGGMVARRLREIQVDLTNPAHMELATRISPWFTSRDLPREICSEHDTEDWVLHVLDRPSVIIFNIFVRGRLPVDSDPYYPYISSAPSGGRRIIPDAIVVMSGNHPDAVVSACVEVKTHGVLSLDDDPLDSLALHHPGRPKSATKFTWPKSLKVDGLLLSDTSRIILQVWCQLVDRNTRFGMLSSFDATIFTIKMGDALLFSETYGQRHPTLFFTVCWMLLAGGYFPIEDIYLPKPDDSWWTDEIRQSTEPGVCKKSLPPPSEDNPIKAPDIPRDGRWTPS